MMVISKKDTELWERIDTNPPTYEKRGVIESIIGGKNTPYRCGIIGCGFIGVEAPDNHARAYIQCTDTDLVALCDIKLWDSPFGNNQYTDYRCMVKNENLDIVSICTPPKTHCQIVCDVAPYVKAIYCEKPIALTLEDADRMIEVCHKYNVILQINHQRNFMRPIFRFSRGWLNTGTHMFALLQHLGIDPADVEIQQIETNDPIFEFDCTHNTEPMILEGIKHLISCIEQGKQSICSGEVGRQSLALALQYKKLWEKEQYERKE